MNIAILASRLESGGAERVAINLANAFVALGHSVDLVLLRSGGPLQIDAAPEVGIVDLDTERARFAVWGFRKFVRDRSPDVVLAINFEMNLVAAMSPMGKRQRPVLLLTVHAPVKSYLAGSKRLWGCALQMLSRLAYRRAERVIAVSKGISDDLVKLRWVDPEKVVTIHNPVLPENVDALASIAPGHPWFGDRSVPVILSVGRLTRAKNFSLLIAAFALLRRNRPARLAIAGEGECRNELEATIEAAGLSDSVQLLGHKQNPYPFYRAADLFVMSSDFEGFGNVLVEAMSVGTPVVSTDCPYGPAEILENGKWGRLVEPGNPAALASAMSEALDEGLDARSKASEFEAEKVASKYLSLIESLLNRIP